MVRLAFSCFFFFSSRRRHTRLTCDWSSDVCSSDLAVAAAADEAANTFGTDSVAEQVEYGFSGDVGVLPPMDHRLRGVGISVRSEERRVGKEWRCRGWPDGETKEKWERGRGASWVER